MVFTRHYSPLLDGLNRLANLIKSDSSIILSIFYLARIADSSE